MWDNDNLLSEEKLDEYSELYECWAKGDQENEIPELGDDDFRLLSLIIEDLFEHIRCQKNRITDLLETSRSIQALGSTLMKDVESLRKLKRKATDVSNADEKVGSDIKKRKG